MTNVAHAAASRARERRSLSASWFAAGLWSAACLIAGLAWTLGATGFPFEAPIDAQAELSILGTIGRDVVAPLIAIFGGIGLVVSGAMRRPPAGARTRAAILAWSWVSAVVLALVVPDYRLLVLAAYAPIFLVGGPLGILPEGASLLDGLTIPVFVQGLSVLAGAAWALTAVRYARTTGPDAGTIQRSPALVWHSRPEAARWSRYAVAVAVITPLLYAVTRFAWALGIPLGVTEAFLREGEASGMWVAGAGLATVATIGAVLTTGLVARWGEVFPSWLPIIGRRSVPPMLAVIPALLVAVLVTSAGLMFIRLVLRGGLEAFGAENWAAVAPELLWPIWGMALALAAVAYHDRRAESRVRD